MNLTAPFPVELLPVARKVVWHDSPEGTIADLPTLAQKLPVSAEVLEYVPKEERYLAPRLALASQGGAVKILRRWCPVCRPAMLTE